MNSASGEVHREPGRSAILLVVLIVAAAIGCAALITLVFCAPLVL